MKTFGIVQPTISTCLALALDDSEPNFSRVGALNDASEVIASRNTDETLADSDGAQIYHRIFSA